MKFYQKRATDSVQKELNLSVQADFLLKNEQMASSEISWKQTAK